MFPDGTTALPSIANDGDADTGFSFPAANTLSISTGGTEQLRVSSAGLFTGSGTSLGAWTSYTPTASANLTVGTGGTLTGAYCQIGKTVHFRARAVLGSSGFSVAGNFTLSLPVTYNNLGYINPSGITCLLWDDSASTMYGTIAAINSSSSAVLLRVIGTNGQATSFSSTVPFTWAASDTITIGGTYEIA